MTRRRRWPADPVPELIISRVIMVMLDYKSLSK